MKIQHLTNGLTLAAAISWAVSANADGVPAHPDPVTLSAHDACAAAAQTRVLSGGEVAACTEAYLAVKLAFIPGVSRADYAGLSAVEKAAVNRAAYAAYSAWRAAQAGGS